MPVTHVAVAIPDAATYTVLASNSGLVHYVPDLTATCTITPPTPKAGLWFDFGHHHHGLTLGPATGRLLAEMMTGEAPYADPTPFAAERFN